MAHLKWPYDSWVKKYDLICGDNIKTRERGSSLSLILNPIVYFSLSSLSDHIGRRTTLMIGTSIVWTGYILLYFMPTFVSKMAAFGFSTGCDGTFTTLFILGLNEATRKHSFLHILLKIVSSRFQIQIPHGYNELHRIRLW